MSAFDAAVFVGRFQPFHLGHMAMVGQALEVAQRLVIVLGSASQARTPKNPFTWQERQEMILVAMPPDWRDRLLFLPMRDFYDEERWVQAVQGGVRLLLEHEGCAGATQKVVLVGHFKDDSSAYLSHFPGWQLRNYPRQNYIDASDVRRAYFLARPGDAGRLLESLPGRLREHVPEATADWLLQWRGSAAFAGLVEEWKVLEDYRASWAGAPYPPMFITVDALVQCQGHVLLVERGRRPGKGLYALPGGYLEPRDTLWQSCLRELAEETGLALEDNGWQVAFRSSSVFDHPDRSLRGRTVTHVFHFDLGWTALPEVHGGDDASAALWMPIAQLAEMPERFFDDHFFILDVLLQLTHQVSYAARR